MNCVIEPHIRPLPSYCVGPSLISPAVAKVHRIVVPLLMVCSPLNRVINLGTLCYWSLKGQLATIQSIGSRQGFQAASHFCFSLIHAGSLYLFLLHPYGYAISTHALAAVESGKEGIYLLADGEKTRAACAFLKTVHDAVYVVTLSVGGPELMATCLIAQAVFELYQARESWIVGDYAMCASVLALAGLRMSAALPYLEKSWFNLNRISLTKEQFVDRVNSGSREVPSVIEWIDLSDVQLKNAEVRDVRFQHCRFNRTNFVDVSFDNISFNNCDMQYAVYDRCTFKNVWWVHADCEGAFFNSSSIQHCMYSMSSLVGSIFEKTSVHHSCLVECDIAGATFPNGVNPFWSIYSNS